MECSTVLSSRSFERVRKWPGYVPIKIFTLLKKKKKSVLTDIEMLLQEKEGVVIEMPNERRWIQEMYETHWGTDWEI